MLEITGIVPDSPAAKAGIRTGDLLVSLNGQRIVNVSDYCFATRDNANSIVVKRGSLTIVRKLIKSEAHTDDGLEFSLSVADERRSCGNKCIFCIIDQLPPQFRGTLSFNAGENRLSFFNGDYLTLNSLSSAEVSRIIATRTTLNVSVHTTNPELRCKMLGNPLSGEKLRYLKDLTDAGVKLNCRIVLCPGYNDGAELDRTLTDLCELMPNISGIVVLPVCITKHRDGLSELLPFTREKALHVITQISSFESKMLRKHGTRLIYPHDEFFQIAGMQLPHYEFYEDFHQLSDGVGRLRLLHHRFCAALPNVKIPVGIANKLIVAPAADFPMINKLVGKITAQSDADMRVVPIVNECFGANVTSAEFITGADIISQLNYPLSQYSILLIPSEALRPNTNALIDGVTINEIEARLNLPVKCVDCDGEELLNTLLL